MVPTTINRRGQHRRNCLLAFLENCLNDPSKENLIKWIDESQGLFQILWVHGGRSNYKRSTHGCLFDLYREYRGRNLISDPKQTFRMALKKSPCIQAADGDVREDWRPFRIVHKCHDDVIIADEGKGDILASLAHQIDLTAGRELRKGMQKGKRGLTCSERMKEEPSSHVLNSSSINGSSYSYSISYENGNLRRSDNNNYDAFSNNLRKESDQTLTQYNHPSPPTSRSSSLTICDNCDYQCWNKYQSVESSECQIKNEEWKNLECHIYSQLNNANMNISSVSSTIHSTYTEEFNLEDKIYKNTDSTNNSQFGGFVDVNPKEENFDISCVDVNPKEENFDISCVECVQGNFTEDFPFDNDEVWNTIEKILAMYRMDEDNYPCV